MVRPAEENNRPPQVQPQFAREQIRPASPNASQAAAPAPAAAQHQIPRARVQRMTTMINGRPVNVTHRIVNLDEMAPRSPFEGMESLFGNNAGGLFGQSMFPTAMPQFSFFFRQPGHPEEE